MKFRLVLVCLLSCIVSCRGGGGGDDSSLSNNACGNIGLGTKAFDRIVDGTACNNLQRSPVVRLVFVDRFGQNSFCSGSMITSNDVLTAAHCFLRDPQEVVMLTGNSVQSSQAFSSRSWSVHPGLRSTGGLLVNDIAVVHLSSPVNLPTLPMLVNASVDDGEVVAIFGYGTDENGDFDFQDLKSGEMRVSDILTTHIAAKFDGEGSNTCQGDSGGPVTSDRPGIEAIAGVTSSGTQVNCLEGDTTFFTKLSDPSVSTFLQRVVPDGDYR